MLFCMLDIETNGLFDCDQEAFARDGRILEFSAILLDQDLGEIDRFHSLVRTTDMIVFETEHVRDMHTKNGLIEELVKQRYQLPALAEVEAAFVVWISRYERYGRTEDMAKHQIRLAGYGPHFDRRWLVQHMPSIPSLFHYRMRDIRALCEELVEIGFPDWSKPAGGSHRALADCEAQLQSWRDVRAGLAEYRARPAGWADAEHPERDSAPEYTFSGDEL